MRLAGGWRGSIFLALRGMHNYQETLGRTYPWTESENTRSSRRTEIIRFESLVSAACGHVCAAGKEAGEQISRAIRLYSSHLPRRASSATPWMKDKKRLEGRRERSRNRGGGGGSCERDGLARNIHCANLWEARTAWRSSEVKRSRREAIVAVGRHEWEKKWDKTLQSLRRRETREWRVKNWMNATLDLRVRPFSLLSLSRSLRVSSSSLLFYYQDKNEKT